MMPGSVQWGSTLRPHQETGFPCARCCTDPVSQRACSLRAGVCLCCPLRGDFCSTVLQCVVSLCLSYNRVPACPLANDLSVYIFKWKGFCWGRRAKLCPGGYAGGSLFSYYDCIRVSLPRAWNTSASTCQLS